MDKNETKYYHAQNAARGHIGKREGFAGVAFQITEIVAGTAFGVYATADKQEIEALDAAVADPTQAVTTYSQGAYEADLQKKTATPNYYTLNNYGTLPPKPSGSLKGSGAAVVVEGKTTEAGSDIEAPTGEIASIEDALGTAEVKTGSPIDGVAPEQTKRGEKPRRK